MGKKQADDIPTFDDVDLVDVPHFDDPDLHPVAHSASTPYSVTASDSGHQDTTPEPTTTKPEKPDYYQPLRSEPRPAGTFSTINYPQGEPYPPVLRHNILQTIKRFEDNPIFADPKIRDVYYQSIKDGSKLKEAVDKEMEVRAKDKAVLENPGVQTALAPIMAVAEGTQKIEDVPKQLVHGNLTKAVNNVIEGALSVAGGTAPGAAFYTVAKGVEKAAPAFAEEANKAIMPLTSHLPPDSPELLKTVALISDAATGALLFGALHTPKDKPEAMKEAVEKVKDWTPEQMQQVADAVKTPAIAPDVIKRTELENDLKKTEPGSATNQLLSNELNNTDAAIEQKKSEIATAHADEVAKGTDFLQQTREKLMAEREGLSGVSKEIIDGQIAEIDKQLPKTEETKQNPETAPGIEQPISTPTDNAQEIRSDPGQGNPQGGSGTESQSIGSEDLQQPAQAGTEAGNTQEQVAEPQTETPEPPPSEPVTTGEAPDGGGVPETGLTHAETEAKREELGMGERTKREKKTREQLEQQADETIKDGYDVGKLADTILKNNEAPTDIEHAILTKYAAILDQRLREVKVGSPEFNSTLDEITKVFQAAETGGSEAGAALGARALFKAIPDESLAGYFVTEKEINNDAPLTEGQQAQVVKEFNEISVAKDALEKKIADLEAENTKLKAKEELNKITSRRTGRRTTIEKLDTEFEDLSKEFSKIARGTLSAGINPELAGIIGKMVKNRVEKGVVKLADLIDAIHEKVAEHGITKEQIRDVIAGNYTEKKQTRNEAAKNLYELKQEAKLIDRYQKLAEGKEPSSEVKKIQRNQQLESLRKQIKEHDLSKLADYKKRVKNQTEKLEEDLKTGNFLKEEKKKPVVMDAEAKKLKDNLIKLKQEREVRIMRQQYEQRNAYEKTRDKVVEVLNVPRTIMSSMDFSAPLRQSIVATVAHPGTAAKAAIEMFKQSVSQKRFDRWFYDVKNDPAYPMAKEAGLYIADPHDPRLTAKEEMFMNNLAEKIPVAGKFIKGSERAYVGYLNKMRWDLFQRFSDEYQATGKTPENSPALYKELAHYINNSTGRGKLGALESAAPILNTGIFAPRLIASRINMLTNWANPNFYRKVPKEIRVQYFKDMGKFIGLGLTVLSLAKLNGADVETDPRSSDFGKIKSGKTRWDIWGGHQQYIRVMMQLLSGESKSTNTGNIQKLNGEGVFGRTRGDVLLSFLRGKLAPIPAIGADILANRTVSGEKPSFALEAEQHLLPLLYNDIKDAMKDQGVKALFTVGLPSTFGVGVQTYLPKSTKTKTEKKNKYQKQD